MLTTVRVSSNRKTGPIAVTYRAGNARTFGTCPASCALLPDKSAGTTEIDHAYLEALSRAVPRNGQAWAYSHFPASMLPKPRKGRTVINVSTDSIEEAVASVKSGRPAVYAAPAGTEEAWPTRHQGIRFVRCPAELAESFSCAQCGNGRPLCAQGRRDFVVVFVAHGTFARKVGSGQGGCYAAQGPTAITWHRTRSRGNPDDAAAVVEFARTLPVGSLLRHHVAGDVGREGAA